MPSVGWASQNRRQKALGRKESTCEASLEPTRASAWSDAQEPAFGVEHRPRASVYRLKPHTATSPASIFNSFRNGFHFGKSWCSSFRWPESTLPVQTLLPSSHESPAANLFGAVVLSGGEGPPASCGLRADPVRSPHLGCLAGWLGNSSQRCHEDGLR